MTDREMLEQLIRAIEGMTEAFDRLAAAQEEQVSLLKDLVSKSNTSLDVRATMLEP